MKNALIILMLASTILLSSGFNQPIDRSLAWCQQASDRPDRRIPQPPVCTIEDMVWNASGCYSMDLEQGVEYDIQVSHISGLGLFTMEDPSGGVVSYYRWRNPTEAGRAIRFEAPSSGIYSLEIEGVCHVQVSRYLEAKVDGDAVTLRGILDENRSAYGYYVWFWQERAEYPGEFVEIEVKLNLPEGADFDLYEADRFFSEPFSTEDKRVEDQDETVLFGSEQALLLFVRRASGGGEYVLTVRAYTAHWKALPRLVTTIAVVILAILGIAALSRIASKKENLIDKKEVNV